MYNIYLANIHEACDKVAAKVTNIGSVRLFDACMRAFTGTPKAEAVTFSVFINTPVMKWGEATIHNDGAYELRTL